jgi:hypothetical protein
MNPGCQGSLTSLHAKLYRQQETLKTLERLGSKMNLPTYETLHYRGLSAEEKDPTALCFQVTVPFSMLPVQCLAPEQLRPEEDLILFYVRAAPSAY